MSPPLNTRLVTDEQGLREVEAFLERTSAYGFDLETNVTDTFFDRVIRTIQFGDKQEQYVIDLLAFAGEAGLAAEQAHFGSRLSPGLLRVKQVIQRHLEDPTRIKVGQGLQFESEMMWWNFGIRAQGYYDTLLAEKNIWAGLVHFMAKGFWGLEDLVFRYTGLTMSKGEQKNFDLVTPLTQNQIDYTSLDVRLPMAVRNGQLRIIEKDELMRACQIDFDAIPAFADMHIAGIFLDADPWEEIIDERMMMRALVIEAMDRKLIPVVGSKVITQEEVDRRDAIETAWRLCPNKTAEERAQRADLRKQYMLLRKNIADRTKDSKDFIGQAAINYSSPQQIRDAFWELGFSKTQFPKTDDRILERLAKFPALTIEKAFKTDGLSGEMLTSKHVAFLATLPIVDLLRLFRSIEKSITTYGQTWIITMNEVYGKKKKRGIVNPFTGRIHSDISQFGAATGRTSSSDPNIQNIPKGSKYRHCFRARPGYKLITVDYSGCIEKGAFVPLNDGWTKIQDHPDAIAKGIKPVITIVTNGAALRTTPDHRFYTSDGWVEAENLVPGTWVAMQGERTFNYKPDEYWWLTGYWAGDGCSNGANTIVNFACGPKDEQDECKSLIWKVLGREPAKYSNSEYFAVKGQQDFVEHINGLFDKKNLRLPLEKLSLNQVANLLSGLFDADGYACRKGVDLTTKFYDLACDVKQALLSFGIKSTVVEGRGGYNFVDGGLPYFRVTVSDSYSLSKFQEVIGFRIKRKAAKLKTVSSRLRRDASNYIPMPSDVLRGKADYRTYVFNHIHGRPYTRSKLSRLDPAIDLSEWTQYHWEKVVAIEDRKEKVEVFDILDQPEQRFISGGFVVHNCELRILAELSGEKVWLDAFKNGWDVHSVGAEIVFGKRWAEGAIEGCKYVSDHQKCKCPIHEDLRNKVKAINFGLAYGMMAKKLGDELGIPEAEAQVLLDLYYAAFPVVISYLQKSGDNAKTHFSQRTICGRRRRWLKPSWEAAKRLVLLDVAAELKKPVEDQDKRKLVCNDRAVSWKLRTLAGNIEREGKNSPIQGANADVVKIAMAMIWRELFPRFVAFFVNMVHDELVIECPEECVDECRKFVCDTMELAGTLMLKLIPMTVEWNIEDYWSK
jgi:DNA polymerase I-like protein with 3'-5' exonuclease and polymerase domains/intein/homing endonuclease